MKRMTPRMARELAQVAPHTGAWIETLLHLFLGGVCAGRPPHGGVD